MRARALAVALDDRELGLAITALAHELGLYDAGAMGPEARQALQALYARLSALYAMAFDEPT